jgi:hypothetical protein
MNDREFEVAKILLDKGLLAVVAIVLGYWANRMLESIRHAQQARLREAEVARQDALRAEEQRRQEQLWEEERRLIPRTEFDASCQFFGPEPSGYPTVITLSVHNKGSTQRRFRSIRVRLRGLRRGAPLERWSERGRDRLRFPEKLVDDDLVPDRLGDYYFVEPGVRQLFTYPTLIPADIGYALLHIEIKTYGSVRENADEDTFTEERLIQVPATAAVVETSQL